MEHNTFAVIGSWLSSAYSHMRALVGKLGKEGWRPYYCWAGGTIILWGSLQLWVKGVASGQYAPEYFLIQFNIATGLMLGALGLRGIEKFVEQQNTGVA